eukprot:TRINITY_DN112309_c0_g1_i1.p1 TRINITY_DN112309_c0_g1~~TRINITY_DN112309_c0_g1_i1.p1  ORF type:complete len:735 (+),score=87.96 TRINITY_DN112309_c0_g1_i1:29-2233(+)
MLPANIPTLQAAAGNPQLQQQIANQLKQTLKQVETSLEKAKGNTEEEGKCYSALSAIHLQLGNLDNSVKFSKLCLERADAMGHAMAKVGVYNNLCVAHQQQRQYYDVIAAAKSMLAEANKNNEKAWVARAHYLLGDSYHKMQQLAIAAVHFTDCLKAAETQKQGMGYTKCQVMCCLGQCLQNTREYKEAISQYENALNNLEGLPDIPRVKCSIYTALGGCHLYQQDLDEALVKFVQAAEQARMSGNATVLPSITSTIGKAYTDAKVYDQAVTYHTDALELYEKAKKRDEIRQEHYYLGVVLRHTGKYQESIAHLQKAVPPEPTESTGAVYQQLGIAYAKAGDLQAAINYRQKDFERAVETEKGQAAAYALLALAALNAEAGNQTEAVQSAEKAYARIQRILDDEYFETVLSLLSTEDDTKFCTTPQLMYDKEAMYTAAYAGMQDSKRRLEHALLLQRAAVQLSPEQQISANLTVAASYLENGEIKKAQDIFMQLSKAITADNEGELWASQAWILFKTGEHVQAEEKMQKAIQKQTNNIRWLARLAEIQQTAGKEEEALATANRVVQIATESKKSLVMARANSCLAEIQLMQKKVDEAIETHHTRLRLSQAAVGVWSEGRTYWDLGCIYLEAKREIAFAVAHFRVSLQKAEEASDSLMECMALGNIGYCLMLQADARNAIKALQRHVETANKLGETKGVVRSLKSLFTAFTKLGDKERAAEYKEEWAKMEQKLKQ